MGNCTDGINRKQNSRLGFKKLLSDLRTFFRAFPRHIVRYFIQGLIIVLPLGVTLWVLIWLFNLVEGLLAPVLALGLGRHIPGLGFAIIVILVLLIGFLGMKIGQTKFFDSIEKHFIRIPGIGSIYGGTQKYSILSILGTLIGF